MKTLTNIPPEDVSKEDLIETIRAMEQEKYEQAGKIKRKYEERLDGYERGADELKQSIILTQIVKELRALNTKSTPIDMVRIESEDTNVIIERSNIGAIELNDTHLQINTRDNRTPTIVEFDTAANALKAFNRLQSYIYKHVFVINPEDID